MRILSLSLLVVLFGCASKPSPDVAAEADYSVAGKVATVYTTADQSDLRLSMTASLDFSANPQPLETEVAVFVEPRLQYQTFIGIGGAITDASAEVFARLPEARQRELLEAYYNPVRGIGYSLARTTIHSCDFAGGSYTYIDEGDDKLSSFSIDHDRTYRIPMIKRAMEAAGGSLLLYASPWSPPAFMKSNKNMLQGGKLLPEYYQAWADYFVKFIKAYEAEGMPIWGVTVQNEPMAVQRWESCIYTADEERDFVKNFLGPTFWKQGLKDKNIVVWDHNRDLLAQRANTILGDPEAAKYVWGTGFHWYENWSGGEPMFENVARVKEAFPDKQLLFTEGCNERFSAEKYQYWPNAERYGRAMIHDFNNGTAGWTDWNILLDENGGPNHVGNFCFAPVHGDTRTGELVFTPAYYYIGHFSKFIRPGAQRISAASSRSSLLCTAFLNPDGKVATVVMNPGDHPVTYKLYVDDQAVVTEILPHALQTLVF